ncbi:MAG: hypothetical protein IT548_11280 [Alphaproteobacteria bacterium]|nr:hypothetical protein [Alphaproteobacteria bacterium]
MSMISLKWLRADRRPATDPAGLAPKGHPVVAFSTLAGPSGHYGTLKLELAADMSLAPTFTVQPVFTADGARELAGALLALADRLEAPGERPS